MNILLTADEAAGFHTYQLILKSDHTISGLVTPLNNSALHKAAKKKKIPIFEPSLLTKASFSDWITSNKIDVLLNVHLLYIIHPKVLKATSFGTFNLHPGKLPEYAGLNIPSWTIYNGETSHTVTLHRIEASIDTGQIAYSSTFPIEQNDTGLSLSLKSAKKGIELISKLLNDLIEKPSSIPAEDQDLSLRKYYGKHDLPQNGYIDWNKSLSQVYGFIRAFSYHPFVSPWGLPKSTYQGHEIGIINAVPTYDSCKEIEPGTIGEFTNEMVPVATTDYWLLIKNCYEGTKLQPACKLLESGKILR